MTINLHINIHDESHSVQHEKASLVALAEALSTVLNKLLTTAGKPAIPFDRKRVETMTPQEILDEMTTDVESLTTAAESNKAVVDGLRAALTQAIADSQKAPLALTDAQVAGFVALEDKIKTDTASIVAASVANTPAENPNP